MIKYETIKDSGFKEVFGLIKSPFVKYPASLALALHKFHVAVSSELEFLEFQLSGIARDVEGNADKATSDFLLSTESRLSKLPKSIWSAIEGKLDLTVDEAQILSTIIEE